MSWSALFPPWLTRPEGATLEFIAMGPAARNWRGGWFRETQLVCFDATRITPMPF